MKRSADGSGVSAGGVGGAEKKTKTDLITLTRHIVYQQRQNPQATGSFTLLLQSVQLACKFISNKVRKAGLANLTGLAGTSNTTGDDQKKLDVISDQVFINALKSSGEVGLMVTEEQEDVIFVEDDMSGPYAVVFDPLDGSSNIDAGVNIGTIFGIFHLPKGKSKYTVEDVLLPGTKMVCAGYAMYGSATTLVLTTGNGVNGFTLDTTLGEFILSHRDIKIPQRGNIYSINEGNSIHWDEATAKYVAKIKSKEAPEGKPYSSRYIGSMVADVHRTLLYGGIFMYPGDKKSPKGKLRVLYECFPMAMIMEQAGGKASTGHGRILEIDPKVAKKKDHKGESTLYDIHQRSPVFMGSPLDVEDVEEFYRKHPSK